MATSTIAKYWRIENASWGAGDAHMYIDAPARMWGTVVATAIKASAIEAEERIATKETALINTVASWLTAIF